VQHIEDMIENISKVLLSTSAITNDPTNGQPNLLYYKPILEDLASESFHPAGTAAREGIDDSIKLRSLSDKEWDELSSVGTLKVDRLVFRRGKATLLERSRGTLDDLADTLRTQQYYVKINGVATQLGDRERNKKLATERAEAAISYLVERGIDGERIRAAPPSLADEPSVTFTLGQLPY
jgi:outer membrane protein OmpA-like peptidoglycan-associated protein